MDTRDRLIPDTGDQWIHGTGSNLIRGTRQDTRDRTQPDTGNQSGYPGDTRDRIQTGYWGPMDTRDRILGTSQDTGTGHNRILEPARIPGGRIPGTNGYSGPNTNRILGTKDTRDLFHL
ncbi:unnamed protein product [Meloidogyne enterolobii]|uniref:Uncharacterized protein n=1 Tax=Meloidogyne enterolobii TaxID=390850 RepID=A0ACB0Z5I1_MELEN